MQNPEQQPIFNHVSSIILSIIAIISFISVLGFIYPFLFNLLKLHLALIPHELTFSNSYHLITYVLLHSDYSHLGMNMLWLLIFASPIERFFGVRTFIIIFAFGSIVGGLIFLTYYNQSVVIGASAGVSACTGAALRFMLRPASDFHGRPQLYKLTDGRFLMPSFLFFLSDIIYAFIFSTDEYNIAWQSHIIAYVTGAILMEFRFINYGAMQRAKLTSIEETYLGD